MQDLVVDLFDMIKPVGGKRDMLVIVDRCSLWPEACPTKQKYAKSFAKFLCSEIMSWWRLQDRILRQWKRGCG